MSLLDSDATGEIQLEEGGPAYQLEQIQINVTQKHEVCSSYSNPSVHVKYIPVSPDVLLNANVCAPHEVLIPYLYGGQEVFVRVNDTTVRSFTGYGFIVEANLACKTGLSDCYFISVRMKNDFSYGENADATKLKKKQKATKPAKEETFRIALNRMEIAERSQ